MRFSLGLALSLLAGCAAAPYQRIGSSSSEGGYSSTRHTKDTYSVSFVGNEYSSPDQVYDFALLRAAELTLETQHKYFMLVEDRDASSTRTRYNPGSPSISTPTTRVTANGSIYTTREYTPGISPSFTSTKTPAYTLRITMTETPEGPTSLIFDAAETASRLRAKHKISTPAK